MEQRSGRTLPDGSYKHALLPSRSYFGVTHSLRFEDLALLEQLGAVGSGKALRTLCSSAPTGKQQIKKLQQGAPVGRTELIHVLEPP